MSTPTTEKKAESLIESVDLSPKQSLLNLKSGKDEKIEIAYQNFVAVDHNPKKHGDKAKFLQAQLTAAQAMVQPIDMQIKALLEFAGRESYKVGKANALKGGNYLTQETKTKIVAFLRSSLPAFADLSAGEAFERWKDAYVGVKNEKTGAMEIDKAKQALAIKVLDKISVSEEFEGL